MAKKDFDLLERVEELDLSKKELFENPESLESELFDAILLEGDLYGLWDDDDELEALLKARRPNGVYVKLCKEKRLQKKSLKEKWDEIELPEDFSVEVNEENRAFTVNYSLKEAFNKQKKEMLPPVEDEGSPYSMAFDMYKAVPYMLYESSIQNLTSDPFYEDDERVEYLSYDMDAAINWTSTPKLDDADRQGRFAFLQYAASKLADEKILQDIVKNFPRKKDGSFNKREVMRIATGGFAKYPAHLFRIVAKAKSDSELTIYADYGTLSCKEVMKQEDGYLPNHLDLFELK